MLLSILFACAPDPGAGKPKAEIVEPAPAAAPAPEPPAPAAGPLAAPSISAPSLLKVDVTKSKLGAVGAKITATHPITFHDFEGLVGMDEDVPVAVSFAVKMDTLTADQEKLTEHLKTEDFFDVAKFPTATFVSTEIVPWKADGEGKAGKGEKGEKAKGEKAKAGGDNVPADANYKVTGDFTIHGQTKRVAFPATITNAADSVSAKTEFVIDRKDFGVVYPGKPDDLVQDNVVIQVDLVAPRK